MKDTIGNTNRERKSNGKQRAILCIVILTVLLLIGSTLVLWHTFSKPDSSQEVTSIDLSSSCGDKISEGGVGEIFALLHYQDGHTSSGNFIFQSENDEVLYFPDENSGRFNALKQFEQITISVTSQNQPDLRAEFPLEITSHKSFSVSFKYPNAETYNEIADSKEIVEGGMMLDAPTPDFGCHIFKWIVQGKNNAEFNPSKGYYWNENITVEAVFEEIEVSFNDALFNEKFDSTSVTYGEPVTSVTDWQLPTQTDRDGWHFEGWYPDINSDELKNGLQDGRYFALSNTLYAKWTCNIQFEVDSHLGNASRTSQQVVYNGHVSLPTVSYLGQITKNQDDIKFDGWYTEPYGAGEKIDGGTYSFKEAGLKFYDRTLIRVYFYDGLNNSDYEPITIIYGKTLLESRNFGVDTGAIPNLIDKAWIHVGWSYIGTSNHLLEMVTDEISTYADKIGDISYIYSVQAPQFNGSITLNALWELEINYIADRGNLQNNNSNIVTRFGDNIDLPEMSAGSWDVKGWYFDNNVYENRIMENSSNSISTSSNYFVELVSIHAKDRMLNLYAKWGKTVTLVYGNSKGTHQVDVVYGRSMGSELPIMDSFIGDTIDGYTYATEDHWKTEEGVVVKQDTANYPLSMNQLIYQWKGKEYKVTFKSYSAGKGHVEIGTPKSIRMKDKITLGAEYKPTEVLPSGWGAFIGYYYFDNANESVPIGNSNIGGVSYFDKDLNGKVWNIAHDVTLYAVYGNTFSATLDPNGGNGAQIKVDGLVCGDDLPTDITHHTRYGYDFTGYYTEKDISKQTEDNRYYYADMTGKNPWTIENNNLVLYAGWEAKSDIEVIFHSNGGNTPSKSSIYVTFDSTYGELATVTRDPYDYYNGWWYTTSYTFDGWYTAKSGGTQIKANTPVATEDTLHLYAHWSSSTSSCVAKGTLFMLSDGSSVAVENLSINDTVLAFDHATGTYVNTRVLYTYYGYSEVASIELYFSNNIFVEFLNVGHGLFDITLNKYVLINEKTVKDYVGHEFLYTSVENGVFVTTPVKLYSYNVSMKLIERYDIVTEGTLNHIANGLVACSDTLVGICNMFKFNNEYMYDADQLTRDIEQFGLYTYEEWSEYLSYEDFVAFNGAYFKIAVGKGLISIDEIFSLLMDLVECRA